MNQIISNRTFAQKAESFNTGMQHTIEGLIKLSILVAVLIGVGGAGWFAYVCYTHPKESQIGGVVLVLALTILVHIRRVRGANMEHSPTLQNHPIFSTDENPRENTSSSSSQTTKTVLKTSQEDIVTRVKNYLNNPVNPKKSLNLRDKISLDEIRAPWKSPDGKFSVTRQEVVEAILKATTDFVVTDDVCKVRNLDLYTKGKLRDIQLLIARLYKSSKTDDSIMIQQILDAGYLDNRAEAQLGYLYKKYDSELEKNRQQAASTPAGGAR